LNSPTPNLLSQVAAGDAAAMEACLDRYGGLVWSLARRLSPTPADAEDAVQEIFIELWRVADRYDAALASEPTFVATIARRRLIDRRRRHERRRDALPLADADAADAPSATPAPTPPAWLEICDEAQRARRAMCELTTDQQRVLTLAIDGGCTQSEIADRLSLPLGTVKAHARRGLNRLRELLGRRSVEAAPSGGRR
jgi:RNA polymerase sigma-70 factor (ECF subfamily)